MASWVVVDSLYCDEQMFGSHLDSWAHYLNEFGERAWRVRMYPDYSFRAIDGKFRNADVALIMDGFDNPLTSGARVVVAMIASIHPVMPWQVKDKDGRPVYAHVVSSLRWMVDESIKNGVPATWMPLAFDHRALVAGMGVKERDIPCLFLGTTGGNHQRRTRLLAELGDLVTVAPPTFGREMFRLLARAQCVLNIHAEWAKGEANNMRCFEATGMGAELLSDGGNLKELWPDDGESRASVWEVDEDRSRYPYGPKTLREEIAGKVRYIDGNCGLAGQAITLTEHSYIQRIPRLVDLVRSL